MQSQFPQFIKENFVYCSDLHLSRTLRSSLVLLRNLQLYEISKKQIVNCIDLRNTTLSKVQDKLDSYTWESHKAHTQMNETLSSTNTTQSGPDSDMMFGKYIYQTGGSDKVVYIFLKCWSYLLVIRKDTEGFTLHTEYTNVQQFRICKESGYRNRMAIIFTDGRRDITDFQEDNTQSLDVKEDSAYRKILDKVKMKQSELLVHRSITKKEFARLKGTGLFSCNFLRSPRPDEMQILSKCADAWYKTTTNDDIVVGVPLVNNSSSSLTVLQNFKAVICGRTDLSYQFALYQLSNNLCSMENLQSFFTSQHRVDLNRFGWNRCIDLVLRPEEFYVLIIKLKGNEVFPLDTGCLPLFACFDIIASEKAFPHRCFLTALSFHNMFANAMCRLNFDQRHLHRDLLTIVSTSFERCAFIEWNSSSVLFEKFLCSELDFFKISNNQHDSEPMQIDDRSDKCGSEPVREFYFNKSPESVWHGTLISLSSRVTNNCSKLTVYTKTEAKSHIFYSLLATELRVNCAIKQIEYDTTVLSAKLGKLEAALRDECESRIQMCFVKSSLHDSTQDQRLQKQLYFTELKTDIEWKYLRT